MEEETILELESGSSKPHSVQNSLQKTLQNCRKIDYIMNEMSQVKKIIIYEGFFCLDPRYITRNSNFRCRLISRIIFPKAQQPLVGRGLLIIQASQSHSDTPHSLGNLWTGDQSALMPVSSYDTQHLLETSINSPGENRTRNPRKRAAADPHLRQRGHCDRQFVVRVAIHPFFKFKLFLRLLLLLLALPSTKYIHVIAEGLVVWAKG